MAKYRKESHTLSYVCTMQNEMKEMDGELGEKDK
jgi:hypothetical protein